MRLSVVLPVYGNERDLVELHRRLTAALSKLSEPSQIIFVDDRSPDASWQLLQEISALDDSVLALRLSQNVGQQRAIFAGVEAAKGDVVVIMDADLEDPPEEIPRMIASLHEGHDCVIARRDRSGRGFVRGLGSTVVNLAARVAGMPGGDVGSSFLAADKRLAPAVIAEFRRTGLQLMLPTIVRLSERPTWLVIASPARGVSAYGMRTLVSLGGTYTAARLAPRLGWLAAMPSVVLLAFSAATATPEPRRRLRWVSLLTGVLGITLFGLGRWTVRPVEGSLYEIAEHAGSGFLTSREPGAMVRR